MGQETIDAVLGGGKLRVIEVLHVNSDAVYQGRKAGRQFTPRADDGRIGRSKAKAPQIRFQNAISGKSRTCKRQTNAIQQRLFPKFDDIAGKRGQGWTFVGLTKWPER